MFSEELKSQAECRDAGKNPPGFCMIRMHRYIDGCKSLNPLIFAAQRLCHISHLRQRIHLESVSLRSGTVLRVLRGFRPKSGAGTPGRAFSGKIFQEECLSLSRFRRLVLWEWYFRGLVFQGTGFSRGRDRDNNGRSSGGSGKRPSPAKTKAGTFFPAHGESDFQEAEKRRGTPRRFRLPGKAGAGCRHLRSRA